MRIGHRLLRNAIKRNYKAYGIAKDNPKANLYSDSEVLTIFLLSLGAVIFVIWIFWMVSPPKKSVTKTHPVKIDIR